MIKRDEYVNQLINNDIKILYLKENNHVQGV